MMYVSPVWFNGYDIAFELVFAIISLVIAIFSYRVYSISDQRPAKFLSIAFSFITMSYMTQSFFNFLAFSRLNETVCQMANISSVALFDSIGLLLHMVFMQVGLVVLLYMTLKIKKMSIFWLLLLATVTAFFLSSNAFAVYYLISTAYLIIISWHYIENFLSHKQTKTLLIALAFIFLFLGNFHFFLSIDHELFYAIGHFLELAAYILILINLYLVLKK